MANWWDDAQIVDQSLPQQRSSQNIAPTNNWWDAAPAMPASKQQSKTAPQGLAPGDIESIMADPSWGREVLRNLPPERRAVAEQQLSAAQENKARASKSSWERYIDSISDAATMGVRDEFVGGGSALGQLLATPFMPSTYSGNGPGVSERMAEAYRQRRDEIRAEQRANDQDFGVAPKVVGALMVGPGVAAPGTTAAVQQTPNFLARVKQAGAIGAGYGAAQGVLGYDSPDAESVGSSLLNRLGEGIKGGAIGGVVAPALTEAVIPAARVLARSVPAAAEYARRAIASHANPEQYAVNSLAERMVASGVDPAAMRTLLTPKISAQLRGRGITDDQFTEMISRQLNGEPAATVARDFNLTPATARKYYATYLDENPTPLNIVDASRELVGVGQSMPVARLGRAAYSLAGDEAAAPAAEALFARQQTQPGRVTNIIRQSVGGADMEGTLSAAQRQLSRESNKAYRDFYRQPDLATDQLSDLMADPLFRRATMQAQRQARVEAIRANQEAVNAGRAPIEPIPDVTPSNEVYSPQMLDLIQRQLRIAGEGFASNPNNARHAQNLRQVFLDRIEQHYPEFRNLRRTYAEGKMDQEALKMGEGISLRLGAPAREVLSEFESMTPAQQELVRIGFARKLMDMAATPGEGAAVANQFTSPGVSEIIERLFPKGNSAVYQRGQRLLQGLKREAGTTGSKNFLTAGLRTAELESDMGRLSETANAAANVLTGRFTQLLGNLSHRLSTELGRESSGQILKLLTETDPGKLLPLLNRLSQSASTIGQRRAYLDALRQARTLTFGRLAAPTAALTVEQQKQPLMIERQ